MGLWAQLPFAVMPPVSGRCHTIVSANNFISNFNKTTYFANFNYYTRENDVSVCTYLVHVFWVSRGGLINYSQIDVYCWFVGQIQGKIEKVL